LAAFFLPHGFYVMNSTPLRATGAAQQTCGTAFAPRKGTLWGPLIAPTELQISMS
jgi:hypothetical protein